MEYIRNIRQKPEHIRRRIALLISVFVGIIIFSIWIFDYFSFARQKNNTDIKSTLSPFSALKNSFADTKDSISEGVSNLKNSFKK